MNKLLKRQINKWLGEQREIPGDLAQLLKVIGESYDHYEKDRKMLERSIELSSQEMVELNESLRKEIKNQENARIEKEKIAADLIQRNRNLEQFAYIVSHNLRAPVANILGISNLMKTTGSDSEDFPRLMEGLHFSTKQLDEVLSDLMSITQVRNKLTVHKEFVHFDDLVVNVMDNLNHDFDRYPIQVNTSFEVKGVDTVKPFLRSVFYNLISNSIKYRHPEKQGEISISSYRDNGGLNLIFQDNGLGFDTKKQRDKVFGLYNRFHNHVEGKGIGLYMVKTQVEELGGSINVESEVNVGTKFTVQL